MDYIKLSEEKVDEIAKMDLAHRNEFFESYLKQISVQSNRAILYSLINLIDSLLYDFGGYTGEINKKIDRGLIIFRFFNMLSYYGHGYDFYYMRFPKKYQKIYIKFLTLYNPIIDIRFFELMGDETIDIIWKRLPRLKKVL